MASEQIRLVPAFATGDEVQTVSDTPVGTVKQVLADRFEVAATDEDLWLRNSAVLEVRQGRVTLVCDLEALPEYIVRDVSASPLGREVRS